MTSLHSGFSRYETGNPTVYCADEFRSDVGNLFLATQHRPHIANFNELVQTFATGTRLSTDSFHKEDCGYAFISGPLRFYGVYSDRHRGTFVLSHAIRKKTQKLAHTDRLRMAACLRAFDMLDQLP
jgi:hypothetical protein